MNKSHFRNPMLKSVTERRDPLGDWKPVVRLLFDNRLLFDVLVFPVACL